jgi:hypothetical protein
MLIHIQHGKGGRDRYVPLSAKLLLGCATADAVVSSVGCWSEPGVTWRSRLAGFAGSASMPSRSAVVFAVAESGARMDWPVLKVVDLVVVATGHPLPSNKRKRFRGERPSRVRFDEWSTRGALRQ